MRRPAQIRVVIVDDNAAARMSISVSLLTSDDITVVGEASDGEEALRVCKELHPDVVLMDLEMPCMDGFSATRALCDRNPALRVIILTTFLDEALMREASDAGAISYLEKSVGTDELIRTIRTAEAARTTATSSATQSTVLAPADRRHPAPNRLTKREREVLTLVVAGWRNQEIAERLGITPATVSYHIRRICARLGVSSRSELGAQAMHIEGTNDGAL